MANSGKAKKLCTIPVRQTNKQTSKGDMIFLYLRCMFNISKYGLCITVFLSVTLLDFIVTELLVFMLITLGSVHCTHTCHSELVKYGYGFHFSTILT